MKKQHWSVLAGLAVTLAALPQAYACGDKLSMMGGGVGFEMLNPSLHPARVVVFVTPDSPLFATRSALQKKLERAGHTVTVVDGPDALQKALRTAQVDVVLTNLTDERSATPVNASARAPALLSVVYKPTASSFSATSANVTCTTRMDKSRGSQVLDDIENVMSHQGTGLASDCAPAGGAKST
jgi:CheY-like chemotaxis protein